MKLFGHALDSFLLVLSDPATDAVRRDPAGVPTAFRILKPGRNSLTIDGQQIAGNIEPADIRAILDFFRLKGEDIPIDCEHLLQMLADKKGVTEAELLRTEPLLGEKAAAGFIALSEQNGELWATITKLSARARELLAGTADKIYGYFSPVIRGLKDGPLRITSIALTNLPALNKLDMLAASDLPADSKPPAAFSILSTGDRQVAPTNPGGPQVAPTRSTPMEPLKKLIAMFGFDAAALTAEKADLTPLFQKTHDAITAGRDSARNFLASVKDALQLTDADTLDTLPGKLLPLVEKAKGDAAALAEIQTRVQTLEAKDRDRAIDDLKSQGKLTEAMLPWARKQSAIALADWAATAPVIVPPRIIQPGDAPAGDDKLVLTAEDKHVAKLMNHDLNDLAKLHNLKVS